MLTMRQSGKPVTHPDIPSTKGHEMHPERGSTNERNPEIGSTREILDNFWNQAYFLNLVGL